MSAALPPGARLAVVGTGIAGLTAARALAKRYDLTVFEARARLGGHTHTVAAPSPAGPRAVDTGFIVFNDLAYPRFGSLLQELGVETRESDMSFGVQDERTGLEYQGGTWAGRFAQPRNLLRPAFWRLLLDVRRFFREAPDRLLGQDGELPLVPWLRANDYGEAMIEQFIVPMGAAIWSSGRDAMEAFPARFFVRFFQQHGMLRLRNRPTWRVVDGGSSSYLVPLTASFRECIRLDCPVTHIERAPEGVHLTTPSGREAFDGVLLACHSDQALSLLAQPSDVERATLGAMPFVANEVVLHTDPRVMPRARRAWASWNYHRPASASEHVGVTYWMNRLQSLPDDTPYFVTLNRGEEIDPAAVLHTQTLAHPHYTLASMAARARWAELQGVRRTWFAGAYWHDGFHEDGVRSGLEAAEAIASPLPAAQSARGLSA